MRPGRIVLLVIGIIVGLSAMGMLFGGAAALFVNTVARDDDGYFSTTMKPFETPTYALVSEDVELGASVPVNVFADLGTIRIRAEASDPDGEIFVGIARSQDVDAYLEGVRHDVLVDVTWSPFRPRYRRVQGEAEPGSPRREDFWVVSASGTGAQDAAWDTGSGNWQVVVMNANGSPGVAADISAGIKTDWLVPLGVGLLVAGVLFAAGAVVMLVIATRRDGSAATGGPRTPPPPPPFTGGGPPQAGPGPVSWSR